MTGIVVKRNEQEFNDWLKDQHAKAAEKLINMGLDPTDVLSTETGWLVMVGRYEGRELEFDRFQMAFMRCRRKMRSMLKARQVGFSFVIACESVARCHLKDKHRSVCVSYNLDDAKEKIQRVKELADELPLEFQKKIVVDSKTRVAFQSNTHKRRLSEVVSFPSKAPRGKSGDVYLDELAHCQNDRAIYAGATAVISRSGGQLTIGSTPLGRRGMFHGIHTQEFEKYPGYARQRVPWWLCKHFSKIAHDRVKIELCETLPTELRVERYGTESIREQFAALPLEDFQQEFELIFQDEKVAFFPYDLILPCAQKEASEIPVYDSLKMLAMAAKEMGPLEAGYDVGRSRHPSELFIFECKGPQRIMRYSASFKDWDFPRQREHLKQVIRMLGTLRKFRIDETGLGKNLAEDLEKEFGTRLIERVNFNMGTKEELAYNLKILFQEGNIVLPCDRSIVAQIHSIKQKITASGNTVFDVERNQKHHADKMWAIALAVKSKRKRRKVAMEVGVRVISDGSEPTTPKVARDTSDKGESEAGLIERVFTLPAALAPVAAGRAQLSVAQERDQLRATPLSVLVQQGKDALVAARVWRASGDDEQAKRYVARYKRVRREVDRRRALGAPS